MLPYIIIVGDEEEKTQTISIRTRTGAQKNNIKLEKFIEVCQNMNTTHALELSDFSEEAE